VVVCLKRNANGLHRFQPIPLPPHHLLFDYSPEWFTFLLLTYTGCPRNELSIRAMNGKTAHENKTEHIEIRMTNSFRKSSEQQHAPVVMQKAHESSCNGANFRSRRTVVIQLSHCHHHLHAYTSGICHHTMQI